MDRNNEVMCTSSAETEISLAFSSASWRINLTICWICLETSASFMLTEIEGSNRRRSIGRRETALEVLRELRRSCFDLFVDEKNDWDRQVFFTIHLGK